MQLDLPRALPAPGEGDVLRPDRSPTGAGERHGAPELHRLADPVQGGHQPSPSAHRAAPNPAGGRRGDGAGEAALAVAALASAPVAPRPLGAAPGDPLD